MRQVRVLQVCGDISAAFVSLIAGFYVRFHGFSELPILTGVYGEKIVIYIMILLFSCYFCGLYQRDRKLNLTDFSFHMAATVLLAFFILSSIYYTLHFLFIGRGVLSISLIFFALFHSVLHYFLQTFREEPIDKQKILVYGGGLLAERMEHLITASSSGYYSFLGYILPKGELVTVAKDKILGHADNLDKLVAAVRPHTLVISVDNPHAELPVRSLLKCKVNGIEVLDTPSFFERVTGKLLLEEIQPKAFVFSDGFQLSRRMNLCKRLMDVGLASLGLVLSAPLLPLLASAIKFDSSGSVLYRQIRVGENDRHFTIYKLRTMRQDAEAEDGAVWAAEKDPRVTRLGQFLRKSRLDEIPQFFNVLRGDMSFIGPRPERPEFVATLCERIPFYSKRHIVKPGLTGWAQVRYSYGASELDAREKLRYDLYYIKNYSLIFDLMIILETVKVVCFGRGGR